MLKVKEFMGEWGKFGKNAEIPREKWLEWGRIVFKVANSKQQNQDKAQRKVSKKVLTKSIQRDILGT